MGSLEPLLPPPIFKYPMKMKLFGLSETKLFDFHRIFEKNEKNQQSEHHIPLYIYMYMNPKVPEILDPPL